jgi:uncharacterized membrane protein HdeD (DUF308 family)
VELLAPARRFGGLLAAFAAVVAALSLLAGLAMGAEPGRAVATGLYLVGAFLLLIGVFAGIRGPLRPKGGDEGRDAVGGMFGIGIFSRGIRTATADERRDSRSTTWLFFSLGLCLIVLGVLVDGRASLLP